MQTPGALNNIGNSMFPFFREKKEIINGTEKVYY